jgi:hexosaminidase
MPLRPSIPLLAVLFSTAAHAQQQPIAIIPQPVSVQAQPGSFPLTKTTSVHYGQLSAQYAADALIKKLNQATGYALRAIPGDKGGIQFTINTTPNPALGAEGYTLAASAKRVVITANQPAGLFYGMQSKRLKVRKLSAQTGKSRRCRLPTNRVSAGGALCST